MSQEMAVFPAPMTESGKIAPADVGGRYCGFLVTTAIAGGDVTVYANDAASGTIIDVIPSGTAKGTRIIHPKGISHHIGFYAAFAGTGGVTFFRA